MLGADSCTAQDAGVLVCLAQLLELHEAHDAGNVSLHATDPAGHARVPCLETSLARRVPRQSACRDTMALVSHRDGWPHTLAGRIAHPKHVACFQLAV